MNICIDIQNNLESLPCINSSDKPNWDQENIKRLGKPRDGCYNPKCVNIHILDVVNLYKSWLLFNIYLWLSCFIQFKIVENLSWGFL